MALPVLNAAKYKTIVPSLKKEVEYRPYLVKEEKILMVALESQDQTQILTAIKDVISSCVYDDLDVNKLTMFDLEALFLKLRSKSVGETTEVKAACEHCETENKRVIKFEDIQMPVMEKKNSTIKLTDDVGVTLSFPRVGDIEKHDSDKLDSIDGIMEILIDCIDSIYDADDVYSAKDTKREELRDFVDSLNSDQFAKLTNYFENLPALKYNLKFKCDKCGEDNNIELKGLQSFFG
jgi:hypothetical protein